MTKSPMMIRYEQALGKPSIRVATDGIHAVGFEVWHYEYIAWLEAIAERQFVEEAQREATLAYNLRDLGISY